MTTLSPSEQIYLPQRLSKISFVFYYTLISQSLIKTRFIEQQITMVFLSHKFLNKFPYQPLDSDDLSQDFSCRYSLKSLHKSFKIENLSMVFYVQKRFLGSITIGRYFKGFIFMEIFIPILQSQQTLCNTLKGGKPFKGLLQI